MAHAPLPEIRLPGEWEPHAALWTTWPHRGDLWGTRLPAAQATVARLCLAHATPGPARCPYSPETIIIIVNDEDDKRMIRAMFGSRIENLRIHRYPLWDGWLCDTGPIFCNDRHDVLRAALFGFNGWGSKFDDIDGQLGGFVTGSTLADARIRRRDWVLEGGSIEPDGVGGILTTRQCLLNRNRGESRTSKTVEFVLRETLGITRVNWLDRGLVGDHTDGHVDNVARHLSSRTVMCMEARSSDDPNVQVFDDIRSELKEFRNGAGERLDVVVIPSPGRIENEEGEVMAASYLNFRIGNTAVTVPVFGTKWDDEACDRIQEALPSRTVVPINCRAFLSGGGGLHCYTLHQPLGG